MLPSFAWAGNRLALAFAALRGQGAHVVPRARHPADPAPPGPPGAT